MNIPTDIEVLDHIVSLMAQYSDCFSPESIRCARPLIGGMWGAGDLWMGSHCAGTGSDGFHQVTYLVLEKTSLSIIGIGDTKADSLADAREKSAQTEGRPDLFVARINAERKRVRDEIEAEHMRPFLAWKDGQAALNMQAVPKRRLQVFNKSDGKCHYCETSLDLHGKWHIEHMMPKALMGGNEPGNLVASCVTCNLTKKDKTAEEFIEQLAAARAAA